MPLSLTVTMFSLCVFFSFFIPVLKFKERPVCDSSVSPTPHVACLPGFRQDENIRVSSNRVETI